MAGAGATLFTAGSVLTAAQVNTYLMDQTVMRFANSGARDAAFGGLGEPVLAEGMLCYLDDQNKVFVNTDGTSGGWVEIGFDGDFAVSTKTGDYTIALNDKNSVVQMNLGGANTVTIPTNAAVPFDTGAHLIVTQLGAGQTTISGDTGVTLYPASSVAIASRYSAVTLVKVATDTWYAIGGRVGGTAITELDIDGATDIGAALADADLFIVDDGAGGTNRKTEASRLATYLFGKVSGAASATSAGVVSLNIGSSNVATAQTVTSASYAAVATAQDVTLTTGTSALVMMSFAFTRPTAPETAVYMSFAVSGATTRAASDSEAAYGMTYDGSTTVYSRIIRVTGLTAGSNTFSARFRYTITPGSSVTVYDRTFTVIAL